MEDKDNNNNGTHAGAKLAYQRDNDVKRLILDIVGYIGLDVTVQELLGALESAECDDEVGEVLVRISSWGGDLQTALTVYDRLRGLSADGCRIVTQMSGLCASAATVIAMAGDVRTMSPYGLMLIHRASSGTWGNVHDHEQNADKLAKIDERMAALYADRSGSSAETIAELMDKAGGDGVFLDPQESYAFGFLTEQPADENPEGVQNLGRRILDSFTENEQLATRLDEANSRLAEQTAECERLRRDMDEQKDKLGQVALQLAEERRQERERLEARIAELEAALDTRPTACDRLDGDTAGWADPERLQKVKQILGK